MGKTSLQFTLTKKKKPDLHLNAVQCDIQHHKKKSLKVDWGKVSFTLEPKKVKLKGNAFLGSTAYIKLPY